MTKVLITGGGITGLCVVLTLHQISVPFHIFETSRERKPLGVGINLQPSAVRKLIDLGPHQVLIEIGVETKDYEFLYQNRAGNLDQTARTPRRIQVATIFSSPRAFSSRTLLNTIGTRGAQLHFKSTPIDHL